ncbi:type I glyceraldehyde-3-phosphate dehydrogenase [Allohahella marinimesophila]|uniref:Type I glyceraldehyde-3-phosphate dehydrogenase n=1 Tax=Allohahella marinimesophila TaxID=1054972 RepID=A0ABP7QBC2_9GAMM
MIRIAINGLGRIGRAVLKQALKHPDLEIVAVNDLQTPKDLRYLLQYDTAYGRFAETISTENADLLIGQQRIRCFQEKEPSQLPWDELKIDVVFECTGAFNTRSGIEQHLKAGATRAIMSAPPKGKDETPLELVVAGINSSEDAAFSAASCTTNCIAPVMEILDRRIGIAKAVLNTIHAYTSSQSMVDAPAKKPERGRAGAMNMVPTSTGAAKAATQILPQLKDRFDGLAVRVPVLVGSIADITFVAKRSTSVDEVNSILREEQASDRYQAIISVTDDPIVSADIVQDPHAGIVDLGQTKVVADDLVKVMVWYDNEWGYAAQMIRAAEALEI